MTTIMTKIKIRVTESDMVGNRKPLNEGEFMKSKKSRKQWLGSAERYNARTERELEGEGRLMVSDANWYMNFFDPLTESLLELGVEKYLEKYDERPAGFDMNQKKDSWTKLPLPGVKRPNWDEATCFKIGFENFQSRENLSNLVYTDEKDVLLYGATPMFMICADKPAI